MLFESLLVIVFMPKDWWEIPPLSNSLFGAVRQTLVGERLDRDRVIRAATLAKRLELHGLRDQRFPRAGGGVEDDVLVLEEFEDSFFLVVVGLGVS